MADVTHTATSVVPNAGGSNTFQDVTWGEAVTGGAPVYLHTDNKFYLALCDTAAHAAVVGFATSAGAAGQRGQIQLTGRMTMSGGFTRAVTYYVSDNAGAFGVVGDRGSGDYNTVLGTAISSTVFQIGIVVSGVAI